MEAFRSGYIEQLGRGGYEDDFRALEHFAGDERSAELQGIGPSQGGSVE